METDTRSVQSTAGVPGNIIPTYADSLAREILTSMQSQHTGNTGWQSPSTGLNSSRDIDMDKLAQKITSNVIQAALEKIGRGLASGSQVITARAPLAVQSSIDYPDAPPPTPLVPKKAKNRSSFSRKLKGGLAKEFLPSPPPPTPKDQACSPQEDPDMADKKAEFVDRLIRSLSLECSQREQEKEEDTAGLALSGDQSPATERILEDKRALSNYAAQLSLKIINWGYNSLADLKQLSSECLPKSHSTKETSEAREGEDPSCHIKSKSTGKDIATKQNRSHWDILQIHANQWAGDIIKESLKIVRQAEEAKSGTHPDNHSILSQESQVVSISVEGASGCSPLTYNYVPLSESGSDATVIESSHNFCAPQKANLNSLTRQMISDVPLQTVQQLQEPTSDSFKDPVHAIAEQLSKRIVKDSLLSVVESNTAKACGSPVKRSGVHMPELKPRVRQPMVTSGNSSENVDTVAVKSSVQESVKTRVSKQDNSFDSKLHKLQSDTKLPWKLANTQMPAYRAVSHLDSQNDISTQQLVGVLHWITASQMQTSVLEIATTAELLCSQVSGSYPLLLQLVKKNLHSVYRSVSFSDILKS
ncbi:AKA11 protein, partial [Atractosteus spatula]|nr:AKA11 protein [Atractosteus spatula]